MGLVAIGVVLLAAALFQAGNRRQSYPAGTPVDIAVELPAEILWTGGACVVLQTRTAWWGWRSTMEGSIPIGSPSHVQWSPLSTWDRLTRLFREAPCVLLMLNDVDVALPDDLRSGIYRICDRDDRCVTVEVTGQADGADNL